jgi:hypothetical protein
MGARGSLLAATAVVFGAIAYWWVTREDPDPAEPDEPAGGESAQQVRSRAAPSATQASPRKRSSEEDAPPDDTEVRDAMLADARAQRASILSDVAEDGWNDALRALGWLDADIKDAAVREAIGFDALAAQVISGRDRWFSERVGPGAFAAMDELIAAKAREPTIAEARAWALREVDAQMWEEVVADLGLSEEGLRKYWKSRRVAEPRKASYGAGSFIVLRPRSDASSLAAVLEREAADVRADERWWDAASAQDRAAFLTALVVETSGRFAIVSAGKTECDACRGSSYFEERSADGGVTRLPCASCNGCGGFRSVTYR